MESEPSLQRAERQAQLGLPVSTEVKHRLIKRVVLKLTWFITRHQMDYNLAMVKAVEDLTARTAALEEQVVLHRHHVSQVLAGIEASLRAEILGSDRRGDQIETDLIRLSATVAALQTKLETMATAVAEASPTVTDSDVAEVRSLPGQVRR